jgi:anti-sigma factor RsiW
MSGRQARCKINLLTLSEYVDGELGFFRYRLLSRHLRDCRDCRERLSELKAADAIVHLARDRDEAVEREGAGLPGRLQVELGIGPLDQSREAEGRARSRRRWIRPVAAAAAILFTLAAGLIALHYPSREADALLALGMENRARASLLLDRAEAIEVQIHGIRLQLIQQDLREDVPQVTASDERAAIEERLAELSELVVSLKADARRYMRAYEAAVAAVERQDPGRSTRDPEKHGGR